MDVVEARKILSRALKPKEAQVEKQLKLAEKKIRIACALKCGECTFTVLAEMKSENETIGIAILVANELKKRGFDVKIRKNQIKIIWLKKEDEA